MSSAHRLARMMPCLCAAWLASGCSLMDLGDFGLTNCDAPAQCDALNQRDGLGASDCVIWQCRKDKRGCEQRPRDIDGDQQPDALTCADLPGPLDCADNDKSRSDGAAERCDRKDNDCDGLIDEDATVPLDQHAAGNVEAPAFLSYAQGESDALYLMLGTRNDAHAWVVSGEEPSELAVSYLAPAAPDAGKNWACAKRGDPAGSAGQCDFSELALAAVGGELVTAGVNMKACARGQLRVGLSDGHDFTVQLGSSAQDSNLEWGVDVDPEDQCTAVASAAHGARSPRSAALDADAGQPAGQAIALWLAAPADKSCTGDVDVAALALWPHLDQGKDWLEGGHQGHAELLGRSAHCTAPSIAALRAGQDSGYAIAFAHSDAVELLWLPRPNALDTSLAASVVRTSIPTAEPTHVALALLPGGQPSKGRGLLVTWRSATTSTSSGGTGSNALGFAPLGWSATGIAPGEAQTLARDAEITAGPVAAYARSGFATEALDASESTGGWLLLWVEADAQGSHLLALRVADVGGGRVLGAPFELEAGGDPQFPFVCAPGGSGGAGFEYGFVARDGSAGELTLGSVACPASE